MSPTRNDNNILDLIITDEAEIIDNFEIKDPITNSDHNVLVFDIFAKTNMKVDDKKRFNYAKGDYGNIKKDIEETNWEIMFSNKESNTMWELFMVRNCVQSTMTLKKNIYPIKNKEKEKMQFG